MLRFILNAGTAIASVLASAARLAGQGVARTLNIVADVLDVTLDAAGRVIKAPLAILGALRQAAFPSPEVPIAPAQAAAENVMSALEEARQKGPEQILSEGQALLDRVKADPARKVDAAVVADIDTLASAIRKRQAKGHEASVIAHWARARVDGIVADKEKADIRRLPERLQVWARSLTDDQVREVAKMPRQLLHHHLTAPDCHLWSKTLPAASLDTAERAKHAIRTAMAASKDGIVDPYPQQRALDGKARKHELDAFKNFEYKPAVGPRI